MLIGIALGTLPSNFTFPLTLAVPWLPTDVAALPAFTARRPEMQMIAVKPNTRIKLLVFITPYLLSVAHVICFSPYRGSPELSLLPTKSRLKEVAGGIVIRRLIWCHFGVTFLSSDTHYAITTKSIVRRNADEDRKG
jgi:hypothetical protein